MVETRVNAAVNQLTQVRSTKADPAARMQAKTVTEPEASTPDTTGRLRVRAMTASIRRSTAWLKAAPAAAPSPIPAVAAKRMSSGTIPGTARNMPTTAVNTMAATTLGLHTST